MTNTVTNTSLTPMSRTKSKMTELRTSLKKMGFKQVILNRSNGKERNGRINRKVSVDYVEFFVIPDKRHEKQIPAEQGRNIRSVGLSYSYIDKDSEEHTVQLNTMDKLETFNEEEKRVENHLTFSAHSNPISISEYLILLGTLNKYIEMNPTLSAEEFIDYFIEKAQLK